MAHLIGSYVRPFGALPVKLIVIIIIMAMKFGSKGRCI